MATRGICHGIYKLPRMLGYEDKGTNLMTIKKLHGLAAFTCLPRHTLAAFFPLPYLGKKLVI